MNIINLTPHALNIRTATMGIIVVHPSGTVARVEETIEENGEIGGITLYSRTLGGVTGLPPQDTETRGKVCYLVSGMVAAHPSVAGRWDVASPGPLIRDDQGQPIGCEGLFYHEPVEAVSSTVNVRSYLA